MVKLPKGWEVKKVIDVTSYVNRGISPKYTEYDGFVVINQRCIRGNKILLENSRLTDPEKKKISDEKYIQKYDVLVNSTGVGTLGRVAQVKKIYGKMTVDSHVTIVRPNDSIHPSYFGYTMVFNQPLIEKMGEGATGQTELSRDRVKNDIEIFIAPHNDQPKIATILSNYDDLIENNTKRIQLLEKIAKLIYDEWFVKFKFPGHEKVKMVNSELGKIPEGWEVNGITDVEYFNFISKNIKQFEGEKEYFATANIDEIDIIKEGIMYSYKDKPSRAQKQPTIYSVWFARMKDTYKVLGFTKVNESIANNSILSSGFAGFKSEKEIFPFLYYSINSIYFHKEKDRFATGATQVSLNNDGLSKIKILIPPKEVINSFGDTVLSILNEIFIFQIKNKTLSKTRDLLLPKLISGQVNISDLDIKVLEVEA